MPAHLRQNEFGVYYLIDGFFKKSLKTKTKRYAEALKRRYEEGKYHLEAMPTVQEFYDKWIGTKIPPLVRHSQVRDYKQSFRAYILPRFKEVNLSDIGTKELTSFQVELLKKGLAVKTVRNIIDGNFRALYRDARVEIGGNLEGKDPFIDIRWPKVKHEPPDPLTIDEKAKVLEAFAEHEPYYYPFMRFQFDTGMRPSESAALTWADINVEARTVRINKSRYMGNDNDSPKTTKSGRTITIGRDLMDLVLSLRHSFSTPGDKVFLNKFGEPLNMASFSVDYWNRVLKASGIAKHKFYAARHTFITAMVKKNINLKRIADYCGTSAAMIEQHYSAILELDPDDTDTDNRQVLDKQVSKLLKNLASPTGFEPVLSA